MYTESNKWKWSKLIANQIDFIKINIFRASRITVNIDKSPFSVTSEHKLQDALKDQKSDGVPYTGA